MPDNNSISPAPSLVNIGDDVCTGCSACACVCPKNAITMTLNKQGFYRPTLRDDLCNECGICLRFCPASQAENPNAEKPFDAEIYAAWSNDTDIHLSSSSGGIFSEIAKSVLNKSGVVCGCAWGQGWVPRHILIDDIKDLPSLRGSKYVPSHIHEGLFRELIDHAKRGTPVLFSGTPCQVAGLDRVAPPEARNNMILVDLVCHGVPSLTSFLLYLDWRFGGRDKISHFSFRNKDLSVQTICAIDQAGSKYLKTCGENSWFRAAMVYHLFLQRICFTCPFGNVPRIGDITLGDFWGIPEAWSHGKGDSLVLANTAKGKTLIQGLIQQGNIRSMASDYSTASKKIGRLKGVFYPLPRLRSMAMGFVENGNYLKAHRFCIVPLKAYIRYSGALSRRLYRLRHFIRDTK